MNKILKIFTLLLFISACGDNNLSQLTIKTSNGDVSYKVETASTVEELQTGLMNRDSLPSDRGMLFDLSSANVGYSVMWMKDTKIALDMIFITSEGFVMWIKENATPMSEELIVSPFKADAVLEINAGEVAKHGIKVGDTIKHSIFPIKKVLPQVSSDANNTKENNNNDATVNTNTTVTDNPSAESNVGDTTPTPEETNKSDTTTEESSADADTTSEESSSTENKVSESTAEKDTSK